MSSTHTATVYDAPEEIGRFASRALIAGIIILLVSAALAIGLGFMLAHDHQLENGLRQFFKSYLVAYVFWIGIGVGSMAIMMLHHMSGGAWGLVIRRPLEAQTRTLMLLMVPLFVPLALGITYLYEWSHHDVVAADPVLKQKEKYLNVPFFLGRAVFYFAVWGVLAYLLNKWSAEQDIAPERGTVKKMQSLSGPGIVLFGLTVTFAAVDWVMSLEPHWFSTIYGLLIMAGWGLSALAMVIAVAVLLSRREPMSHVYQHRHFQDHGKLLLAFVMIYAYFAFSQFLIIWSGNLAEEIPWYLRRMRGGWQWIGVALIVFHFFVPFFLLLSRHLKRHGRTLIRVAVLLLLMRVVDLIFLIAPAFQHEDSTAHVEWLDLVTMFGVTIGVGGIWLSVFARELRKRPLLPIGAPDLDKALEHETGHH